MEGIIRGTDHGEKNNGESDVRPELMARNSATPLSKTGMAAW